MRRNLAVLDEALGLVAPLREAVPATSLKLTWLPGSERRGEIRKEMEEIAARGLKQGAELAARLSALLSKFDLPQEPSATPDAPQPEGGGSIKA